MSLVDQQDPTDPQSRVSTRMALLMFEMLRLRGVEPEAVAARLPSLADMARPYISWADYVKLMGILEEVFGDGQQMRVAMKTLAKSAYSELRALAGFFPSLMPFFAFVNLQLMREMSPACQHSVQVLSERRARAGYRLIDGVSPCQIFWDGTIALIEIFPWHADLEDEAKVQVVRRTDRELEVLVEFPEDVRVDDRWGVLRHRLAGPVNAARLSAREQEVLDLVAEGLTNAEIAARLGTAAATVKNQISSILAKMDAANRTELAARVGRK